VHTRLHRRRCGPPPQVRGGAAGWAVCCSSAPPCHPRRRRRCCCCSSSDVLRARDGVEGPLERGPRVRGRPVAQLRLGADGALAHALGPPALQGPRGGLPHGARVAQREPGGDQGRARLRAAGQGDPGKVRAPAQRRPPPPPPHRAAAAAARGQRSSGRRSRSCRPRCCREMRKFVAAPSAFLGFGPNAAANIRAHDAAQRLEPRAGVPQGRDPLRAPGPAARRDAPVDWRSGPVDIDAFVDAHVKTVADFDAELPGAARAGAARPRSCPTSPRWAEGERSCLTSPQWAEGEGEEGGPPAAPRQHRNARPPAPFCADRLRRHGVLRALQERARGAAAAGARRARAGPAPLLHGGPQGRRDLPRQRHGEDEHGALEPCRRSPSRRRSGATSQTPSPARAPSSTRATSSASSSCAVAAGTVDVSDLMIALRAPSPT